MPQFKVIRSGHQNAYVAADELDIHNGHLMLSGASTREGAGTREKAVVAAFANTEWVSAISTAAELFDKGEVDQRVAEILGKVRDRVARWRDEQGENNPPRRNAYDNVIGELDERLRRLDVGEPVF